jgi:type II secretory pathway pseudopilin PulG
MIRRFGVSLVELVVVLGIIAVMLGLFFPAVQRVRDAARTTVCKNNLYQINLALSQYAELAGIAPSNSPDVVGGWTYVTLQFLEQMNLDSQIPKGISIDDLAEEFHDLPRVLQCPSQANQRVIRDGVAAAHYRLSAWPSHEKRDAYGVVEVPLDQDLPWASSPELSPVFGNEFTKAAQTAHNGGYHSASGFQNAVRFNRVD